MKKILTFFIIIVFTLSFYLIPSLSAITLGEIKPDDKENEIVNEKPSDDKKEDDKLKNNEVEDNKKKSDDKLSNREERGDRPERKNVKEINPRLVCLLSILIPGGGQFYLNNDSKGIAFCCVTGIGYTVSGFFMVKTMLADRGSVQYRNYLLLTGFLFFISLIVHFVGIIEAYTDAEEINKKGLFNGTDDLFGPDVIIE